MTKEGNRVYSQLRDRWMLALALKLMQLHGFQAVEEPDIKDRIIFRNEYNERLPQKWLIKNDGRKYTLIRLQAVDDVWPSKLNKDLRQLADLIPVLRKRLRASSFKVHNVYVFPFEHHLAHHEFDAFKKIEDKKSEFHIQTVVVKDSMLPLTVSVQGLDLEQIGVSSSNQLLEHVHKSVQTTSIEDIRTKIRREEKKQEQKFKEVFNYGKPYLMYTLLLINVLMFMVLESVGSSTNPETLIKYGAKWNPAIIEGEYWRFITPMFLHIGYLHLIFNSIALFFLGGAVERIYGTSRFFWIYLFAGICGTIASFAFTPNLSAGASGAIFGCFGALLYFGLKQRNLFFRTMGMDVIIILIINLGIGFLIPMIDNYGHIGGLIGGFLAAMMLNLPHQQFIKERLLAMTISVAAAIVLLLAGFGQLFDSPYYHVTRAEIAIQHENYSEAKDHLKQAIELGLDRADVLVRLALVYNAEANYEEAEALLGKVVDEGGRAQADIYFQLAYAQIHLEKYEEAKTNLQHVIALEPFLMPAYNNLTLVYIELEQYEYAYQVIERAQERGIDDLDVDNLVEKIEQAKRGEAEIEDDIEND